MNMPPDSKSVLILNRVFPPTFGATGRMACDLALYLRKAGYKITVITTSSQTKTDSAKHLDVIRLEANPHPQTAFDYYKILKMMKKRAKKLPRHDIVISMTDPPMLALAGDAIAKKMEARHVHWSMDIYPDLLPVMGRSIPSWIYKYYDKKMHKVLKKACAIVPISKCMARYMAHRSLPRHKMYVIENWPDRYLFEKDQEDIQSLFDNDKFRILYAGTIGLSHDFSSVLKAAKYLQTHNPEIEFVFTSYGKGKDDFQTKIKEMGLNNIRLIQHQSAKKIDALMATGDIHLVTMKPEAAGRLFPSKFYSALAAGRPVLYIGPDECDIHSMIEKYGLGSSVRNGDTHSLVKSILRYLNDPDAWFTASKNGPKFLHNHTPLQEWEDLIKTL